MITKKQRQSDIKAYEDDCIQEPIKRWKWKGEYRADDYRSTFFLNRNYGKWDAEEILQRCVIAMFLVKCLQAAGYFGSHNPSSDDLMYVSSLALRYVTICDANYTVVRSQKLGAMIVGGAIYPSYSLMNHSCSPNVFESSAGTVMVIRAWTDIKKGSVCLERFLT